jgi:GNAT superfamily N-acetyltransferase
MLVLRSPMLDEAAALTDLCMRSKTIWGYDADFMAACRDELTLTPSAMHQTGLQVAEIDGKVVGVVELKFAGKVALLEKLFVEPSAQKTGTGRQLFAWAKATAMSRGARMLVIESDPHAAGFYRCMGATDDGNVASMTIAGRSIPRLKLTL